MILEVTWVQQVCREQKGVREHVEKWQLMGLSEQREAQRTDCSKEGGVPKSVPLRSLELLWHLSLADREDHYPRVSGALGGTLPPPDLPLLLL